MPQQPPVGHGPLIHEVCRFHRTTHHSRQDSSGRAISSSRRTLPDNTQHSQPTDIQVTGEIRTHNLSSQAAADLCLRPRGLGLFRSINIIWCTDNGHMKCLWRYFTRIRGGAKQRTDGPVNWKHSLPTEFNTQSFSDEILTQLQNTATFSCQLCGHNSVRLSVGTQAVVTELQS